MDKNLISTLQQTFSELKSLLKCPICLECIEDVLEIDCGHAFCRECYMEYKSNLNVVICPICKYKIGRRSTIYYDLIANDLGRFVNSVQTLIFNQGKDCSTPKVVKETSKFKKLLRITTKQNKPDAFDRLMKTSNLGSERTVLKHTYSNKKKGTKHEQKYDILDFDNVEKKGEVLKWLNDTRNKFDRLTQTQDFLCTEDDSVPYTDLPSVSQAVKLRNTIENSNLFRGRAKSLDIVVKKTDNRKKRHTEGCTDVLDNYEIESSTEEEELVKRAEENVLLNLIEDGILDKFENEINVQTKTKDDVKMKIPTNVEVTQSSASGWNRITETKKTMKITDKIPKKLNIVLQSCENSFSKKDINIEEKSAKTLDTIYPSIRKSSCNTKKNDETFAKTAVTKWDAEDDQHKKCYDLNVVEDYLASNIRIDKNLDVSTADNSNCRFDNSTIEGKFMNQSDNINENCSKLTKKVLQSPIETVSSNTVEAKDVRQIHEHQDVYFLPTQQLNNESDPKIHRNYKEIEDDYDCPTQKLEEDFLNVIPDFSYLNSSEDLLNTIDTFLDGSVTTSNKPLDKKERASIKSCIDRLRTLLKSSQSHSIEKNDVMTQTYTHFENVAIQTNILFNNVTVQTEILTKNQSLQTDIAPDTFSECDMRQTPQENKPELGSIADGTTKFASPLEPRIMTKKSQYEINDCFAGTLDNFNFETQEVTKELSKNLDMSQNKQNISHNISIRSSNVNRISQKPLSANTSEHIPNSLLVCSINSTPSKKVNRKLKYDKTETGASKRYRNVIDSDSDDDIIPRLKRNRFIRSDLSIEFETEANTETNKKTQSSAGNESIDYENYLAEVMKKYDDGELFMEDTKNKENRNKSAAHVETNSRTIQDCDEINTKINENIKNIAATRKISNSSESYKTVPAIISESNDVIGKTETQEPIPKRTKREKLVPDLDNKDTKHVLNGDICDEFDDGLDDAMLENLAQAEHNDTPNIKILEDILIAEPRPEKVEQEDTLFSDEDIVETTPQKLKSYNKINRSIICNIKQITQEDVFVLDDEEFNIGALPPPPDFQDDPVEEAAVTIDDSVSRDQITLIESNANKLSATPEKISQYRLNDILESPERLPAIANTSSLTPDLSQFITTNKRGNMSLRDRINSQKSESRPRVQHSTPLTVRNYDKETLGFSPISGKENIIRMTQSSNYNPLTNISKQNAKHSILTSNPKQKSMWNYVRPSQSEKEIAVSPRKKPNVACTRLGKDQIMSISQMTNRKLATYSTTFDSSVTHMIVAVDEHNRIKDYTVKSVAAVAAGIWVLSFDWVQDCIHNNSIVPEEPYEVLDSSGLPGPKTSRLTRKDNPLFQGYKFYCANPFYSTTQQDIQDVIKMLGGKIVSHLMEMCEDDGRIGLIIAEVKASQELEVFENYLDKYKVPTVDIEWLSKSVGRYQLISIRPYVWCSDDRLDELNYPDFLVEHVQSSSSSEYM